MNWTDLYSMGMLTITAAAATCTLTMAIIALRRQAEYFSEASRSVGPSVSTYSPGAHENRLYDIARTMELSEHSSTEMQETQCTPHIEKFTVVPGSVRERRPAWMDRREAIEKGESLFESVSDAARYLDEGQVPTYFHADSATRVITKAREI